MIYAQAVLALVVDAMFWNRVPNVTSLLGCLCVVLSLATSMLLTKNGIEGGVDGEAQSAGDNV